MDNFLKIRTKLTTFVYLGNASLRKTLARKRWESRVYNLKWLLQVIVLLVQEAIYICNLGSKEEERKKEILVMAEATDEENADSGECQNYNLVLHWLLKRWLLGTGVYSGMKHYDWMLYVMWPVLNPIMAYYFRFLYNFLMNLSWKLANIHVSKLYLFGNA